jgi:hypothetical protein
VLAIRTEAPLPESVLEARGLRFAWGHAGDRASGTGRLNVYEADR